MVALTPILWPSRFALQCVNGVGGWAVISAISFSTSGVSSFGRPDILFEARPAIPSAL